MEKILRKNENYLQKKERGQYWKQLIEFMYHHPSFDWQINVYGHHTSGATCLPLDCIWLVG
jgi:hypothetical protein